MLEKHTSGHKSDA